MSRATFLKAKVQQCVSLATEERRCRIATVKGLKYLNQILDRAAYISKAPFGRQTIARSKLALHG